MLLQHTRHQLRLLVLSVKPFAAPELERLLSTLSTIAAVAEVGSLDDAIAACDRYHPELLLLLTDWTDSEALATIQTLHQHAPALGIVVMTMRTRLLQFAAAIAAGARGYIAYEALGELPGVFDVVAQGGLACCSISTRQLLERITAQQVLSPREQLIAAHIAAGHTNDDIAASLGVKPSTVETFIKRILQKTGRSSRVEVAVWWMSQAGMRVEHAGEPGLTELRS